MNKSYPRIITVGNQKGGCAKSTTVLALASSFSLLGKRVLIVDMDFQGNATSGLGLKKLAQKEHKTLSDAIRKNLKLGQVRLQTSDPKIDLIGADIGLNRMAIELTGRPKQFHILNDLLNCEEISQYDIVIVDTHPNLDCMLQSALVASHYLLVPMFAEPDAFEGIVFLFDEFHEIQRAFNGGISLLGIAITKFDAKNSTHRKFASLLMNWGEKNKVKVFNAIIPDSTAIAGARSAKKSVVEYNSSLPVSKAYTSLAQEILPEIASRVGRRVELPEITTSTSEVFEEVFQTEGGECFAN